MALVLVLVAGTPGLVGVPMHTKYTIDNCLDREDVARKLLLVVVE